MTTIIFRKSEGGEYKELECHGHAGYDDYGKDIVCASLSVLVLNTLNSLDELCQMTMQLEQDAHKGYIHCIFPEPPDDGEKLLLDSLALGCIAIEKQYGRKYCRIKIEEV